MGDVGQLQYFLVFNPEMISLHGIQWGDCEVQKLTLYN